MSMLTKEQIRQLNMYSVYLTEPAFPLFEMDELMSDDHRKIIDVIQFVSESPNNTIAASYFMRRWGMFISLQFYLLTSSNVIWDGKEVIFGAVEEYGLRTIGTFVKAEDFRIVSNDERQDVIKMVLQQQCHDVINQIRKRTSVSPLTLWENIFGYLIWHYHVFSSSPATATRGKLDWEMLNNDGSWKDIATHSRFATYTNGKEPSQLLNQPVRKSCCFSKDVPGLMKCTFCPLD